MTRREKILALAVASVVGLVAVGLIGRSWIIKPLKEMDKRTAVIREKIDKIKAERRAFFAAEDQVKEFAERTFADTVDQASAKSGERLTRQILGSGLKEADFTRLPVGPRKLRGASEIGWSVQGDGPLASVVNLIFVLQQAPWLHRIENLVVTAGDAPGWVKVRFRALTLVVEPAPEVEHKELVSKLTLDSSERRLFDGLVSRDILRPYIPRPPSLAASLPTPAPRPGSPPATPGPESLRIVSLSEWQGHPEVHVRDLVNQKTLRYQVGDLLAGGTIVMVDYRSLSQPGRGALQSFSRVILRIGTEHWAVERGKTLADKHKLSTSDLPSELARAR